MCDEHTSFQTTVHPHARRVPTVTLQRAEETHPAVMESLQNVDRIKVENNMDIVTEEDPVGIKTDELYIQSTFSVVKAEPEQDIDRIKVENDVGIVTEEDSVDLKSDEVYTPSAFCVEKAESENCMDLLIAERGSCSERCLAPCHDKDVVIDMKVEEDADAEKVEDPLKITHPAMKSEHECLKENGCIHKEECPFYYDECLETFDLESSLKGHQCMHSTWHPYICDNLCVRLIYSYCYNEICGYIVCVLLFAYILQCLYYYIHV